MKIILTQIGVGAVVSLVASPTGAPSNINTAPAVLSVEPGDQVLIARNGQVQKLAAPALAPDQALLSTVPMQSAGYPIGGYWMTSQGFIQRAPVADMTFQTDGNFAMALDALDFL